MHILLASASARRAALLKAAGFAFETVAVHISEDRRPGEEPEAYVARMAEEKAAAAIARRPDALVLGADTAVILDGLTLGKPVDQENTRAMLRLLSGRTHDVLTGICLRLGDRRVVEVDRTRVRFARLSEEEIGWYVATGEPGDKAGAYAIQGLASRFIEEIQGSYSNVVGLPVAVVYRLLKRWGV